MFLWALENRLDEIEIPTKDVNIYELEHTGTFEYSPQEVHDSVTQRIAQVTPVVDPRKSLGNDFRREDVLDSWENVMENSPTSYTILQFRCVCSSGTYMRVLADMIGKQLGPGGLAWSIKRTWMGNAGER